MHFVRRLRQPGICGEGVCANGDHKDLINLSGLRRSREFVGTEGLS